MLPALLGGSVDPDVLLNAQHRRQVPCPHEAIDGRAFPAWCSGEWRTTNREEQRYAPAIRQAKARTGHAEALAQLIKDGAIPIISAVRRLQGLLCDLCPGRHHRDGGQHIR